MSIITIILATIVALEHFYIFYLESIATQSDATSRVFNMEKEELARPSVRSLFKNQGIYNALLGVFLAKKFVVLHPDFPNLDLTSIETERFS